MSVVNVPALFAAMKFSNAIVPLPGAWGVDVDFANDGNVVDAVGTEFVGATIVDVLVIATGASVDGNTVLLAVKCDTEHFCRLTINGTIASSHEKHESLSEILLH